VVVQLVKIPHFVRDDKSVRFVIPSESEESFLMPKVGSDSD
jgi:hypothetical protein